MSTGEKVFIATHTGNLEEGNWIKLGGGSTVELPPLALIYEGPDSASYTRDGVTITIASIFGEGEATYPISTHQVYSTEQSISAKFWGATALEGETVDFKLLKLSSVSEAREMVVEVFRGNLAPIRDKLDHPTWSETVTLVGSGDASVSILKQNAGSYLLVVVKEIISPYELYIYSATVVEVVDQILPVSAPSSVEKGASLNVNTNLIGTYVHGAVMIKKSAYTGEIKIVSEGTVLSTAIYLNGQELVDGAYVIDTEDMSIEDMISLFNKIRSIFGSSQLAYDIKLLTGSMSISTNSLTPGDYVLLVGVYDVLTSRIVGVYQKTVTVLTPTPPPPPPPPSEPLTPEEIVALPPADAADVLEGLPPGDAAGLLEQITPEEAGAILAEVNPEIAGLILDEMPTEDAVPIIEALDPAAAANILENADANVAAAILDQVPAGDAYAILDDMDVLAAAHVVDDMAVERVVDVVAAAVEIGNVDGIANILNNASEQTVTDVLLASPVDDGAAVIESMASQDLNAAALRVEAMVKERLKYVDDPEVAASIMEHATRALEKVSVASLVDLFREIAGLPATPSTVAAVFEKMDLSVTMNVVDEWIKTGDVASLGEVFGYLTTPTLQKIYWAMTPAQRAALYPALAPATVARLPATPRPAEFVLSDLTIEPTEVELGDEVTISVLVTNVGDLESSTTVDLLVNGVKEQSKTVTLAGGANTTVLFTVTTTTAGSYTVKIGDLTGSFTVVKPLTPAAFTFSGLTLSPTDVKPKGEVTVSVTVKNTGEQSGTYSAELKLDGASTETKTGTLAAGATATVTFKVSSQVEGAHTVQVGDQTGSFTVTAPPSPPPDNTIWYVIGVVVIVAVVIAAYLLMKSKPKPKA
ncbi:MAG: TIGR04279 domain-containing protein [Candidatus Bathyarchaeota archaeon]|nr:TIGR04279 domain-containing protein [Candidatus Bathyarchaeota archaeon]